MDVYLVPIGQDRYELYCEVPDDPEPQPEDAPAGFFRRMKQRFSAMLAEAERERRRTNADQPPRGTLGRLSRARCATSPRASRNNVFSGISAVRSRPAYFFLTTSKSTERSTCFAASSDVISKSTGS